MSSRVESELASSGNGDIAINIVDEAGRILMDEEDGMYFPDQVEQALSSYMLANPQHVKTMSGPSLDNGGFGADKGHTVFNITEDFTMSGIGGGGISGKGILIIEGDFVVPAGVNFEWEGMIVIKPPAESMNPQVDFSGNVNIKGSLVVLHEAMPNNGHMDVTVFRDMTGAWSSPYGVDKLQGYWPWWLYHTHDFTSKYGNYVRFYDSSPGQRIHEKNIHFAASLNKLSSSAQVFFEIYNPATHGRGIMTIEIDGKEQTTFPVAPGFGDPYSSGSNTFRSTTFSVGDLEHLQIDITRLSSLRRMWDDTENPFPGCTSYGGTSGPVCVAEEYARQGALTIRLYENDSFGDRKLYEAALYWHRREDEEEEFEEEMEALVDELKSPSYGVDIHFGDNTSFVADANAISSLDAFGGAGVGVIHLGTWERHYSANHPDNPLK